MSHLHEPRDWLAPGSQSPSPTFGNFGVPKTLLLNTAFSWGVVSNRAGVGKAQGSQRWEERHAPELPGVDGLGVGLREQELNDPLVGRATLLEAHDIFSTPSAPADAAASGPNGVSRTGRLPEPHGCLRRRPDAADGGPQHERPGGRTHDPNLR